MRSLWLRGGWLLGLGFILVACSPTPEVFDGERAFELVEQQISFGPRIPGSVAHRLAGDWILAELEDAGWETSQQTFQYQGVRIRNLVGEGGPDHGEWVLLGTHYDTRPRADRDEENPDLPVPGANDGASGVAVLLEIAHVVNPQSLRQPVRLVFFDAEDSGGIEGWDWIVGSNYYANQLEDYPSAVIVVDMVGDVDLQLYYEQNSDPVLGQEIWEIAAQENFPAFVAHPKYSIIDDHIPFRRLGIPAVDVIDFDYPYWHTADDTLDKLSPESLAQVGHTLQRWLENRNE